MLLVFWLVKNLFECFLPHCAGRKSTHDLPRYKSLMIGPHMTLPKHNQGVSGVQCKVCRSFKIVMFGHLAVNLDPHTNVVGSRSPLV